MAKIDVEGVEHVYAGNPKMSGDNWTEEFPPIETTAQWLRCKETGQIYPNTEDFRYRSDILEPYFGNPTDADNGPAPSKTVPDIEDSLADIDSL